MKKLYLVRAIILAGSLLLQLNTLCFQSRGAAGDVDLSFDPGSGVNGTVYAVAVQSDRKVIIGGTFSMVKGLQRIGIARLNADGSGDSSFDPGTIIGISGYAFCVTLQPDGKVLVGGSFWTVNGAALNNIARLNADGSLDNTFNPGSSANNVVYSIIRQSDGELLIGGYFSEINGTSRNRIARLNANGSLDTSFNPGTGADGGVAAIALQSDGKVLIGGDFATVNGTGRNGIARLNANGSLNASFNPGTGASGGGVWAVAQEADGKVLIGGPFTAFNGTNRSGLARLNTNGSLDSAFNPRIGSAPVVSSILPQADGKIFIGVRSSTVNGTNQNGIARLDVNGSLDATFNPGTGVNGTVFSVGLQSDGKVLIGGDFSSVNGANRNRMARFNADGSLDGSFQPGAAGVDGRVTALVVQPDGKVLIGGMNPFIYDYTFINGTNRYGSARLNADGSLDGTFIPDSFNPNIGVPGTDYSVANSLLVESDHKVLIGGSTITTIVIDPEGDTDQFYGNFLTRFNANGSLDSSFNVDAGITWVTTMAQQSDGKVLAAGNSTVDGTYHGIARLNADGSLDRSFGSATGVSGLSMALQSDGKVLIGGGGNGIARLNPDGSLDSSFNPGATGVVQSVVVQPNGKVLIAGLLYSISSSNYNTVARLNANGSLDTNFHNPILDGYVMTLALQPDGNVLIGGDFITVNGVVRPHVARLYGDSVTPSLTIARSNAVVILSWPVTALNFQLQESTDLSLPNSWSPVSQLAVTNAGQISVTVPTTVGRKFFRLKSQ